jgi:hypothetical protein
MAGGGLFLLYDVEKSHVNAGDFSPASVFYRSQLLQSGIGIPTSGPVRYRWSRISPALPSYAFRFKTYSKKGRRKKFIHTYATFETEMHFKLGHLV